MHLAVKIKFDSTHNVVTPTLVLATRSGKKLGAIPAYNITVSDAFNSQFDLEFKVDKYLFERDNKNDTSVNHTEIHTYKVESPIWDDIVDFKLVWCKEWDVWFEISVQVDDADKTTKNVTGVSLGEAELSQTYLHNVEINTETDIDRDDYEPTVLYNPFNTNASLLHRIMDKVPHYSIDHVDSTIASIQRTFTFDGTSIYDAFQDISEEIDCLFVINSGTNADGKIARSISVYDLENYCVHCGTRGNFENVCSNCGSKNIERGYGEDTTIFITTDNLASNIHLDVDEDSVKNCFRLEAGDDLMTSAIIGCNPNGSQYIWYITDEMKKDMSSELVEKLELYDADYKSYYESNRFYPDSTILDKYNDLIDKYTPYSIEYQKIESPVVGFPDLIEAYYDTIDFYLYLHDELMPSPEIDDTDAVKEAAKLTSEQLSPTAVTNIDTCSEATASSSILNYAKLLISAGYQVKVKNSSYNKSTRVWSGNFVITSYSDEDDTAESEVINVVVTGDYSTYVEQKLEKSMKESQDKLGVNDVKKLFALDDETFAGELKRYCYVSLNNYLTACKGCLDVMVELGLCDEYHELYTIYDKYYAKSQLIEAELSLRQEECETIGGVYDAEGYLSEDGMETIIAKERDRIQKELNFENYVGEDLWKEFIAYRREDTYSNSNYISDGLNNAELLDNASEFIKVANNEIYKSANLQHSLTASLSNLLIMKEFEPIVDYFSVGNWIRVKIDDEIYRLRLISYSINFDSLGDIDVEFSDIKKYKDYVTDAESIFKQASSMASSYDAVARQSTAGKRSSVTLDSWANDGMSLTSMKIVGDAKNQNITWDDSGFLCREYSDETETYSEKQLKIINSGMYVTDDNWKTAKASVGKFQFWNPETQKQEEGYGVIADTLVGNLILGEKIGVYTKTGSISLNEGGLSIIADCRRDPITGMEKTNKVKFTIEKMVTDDKKDNIVVCEIDSTGNLHLNGDINAKSGKIGSWTCQSDGALSSGSVGDQYVALSATRLDGYCFWSGCKNPDPNNGETGREPENAKVYIKRNGDFRFGGENGIKYSGGKITIGSDCSLNIGTDEEKYDCIQLNYKTVQSKMSPGSFSIRNTGEKADFGTCGISLQGHAAWAYDAKGDTSIAIGYRDGSIASRSISVGSGTTIKKITVSASTPSSLEVGELWFVYS